MGAIADISRRRVVGGKNAPSHRLSIGGEDASRNLIYAEIVFEAGEGSGGSGARLELSGSWADYDGAPVDLSLGYGEHMVEYFSGELDDPQDDERLPICHAAAFGPFRLLSTQYLKEDVNYRGTSVGAALKDVIGRAGNFRGPVDVSQELFSYVIRSDKGLYAFGEPLSKVAAGVLEAADGVGADQPGGKRVFMKRPGLTSAGGSAGTPRFRYEERQYLKDGFTARPDGEATYHSVVVVRRDARGGVLFKAEREVKPRVAFAPPTNRIHAVDNFEGTNEEALREAEELARYFRAGRLRFDLLARANYELALYGGLDVVSRKGGTVREYACVADGQITVRYRPAGRRTPGTAQMSVSGRAFERS